MVRETDIRRSRIGVAGGAVIVTLMAGSGLAQEGLKLTEQFVKTSGETVKAISETKLQIGKTLDVYNSLGDEGKDRRKLYKNLMKEMDNCDKRVEGVRKRTAEMNGAASMYFEERGKSLESIGSEDLRARGQARLEESKAEYAQILELGRAAGGDYQGFMAKLRDQVLFLGHDLNPDALASLDEDVKKQNTAASDLFAKIDGTITAFNTYTGALRPE